MIDRSLSGSELETPHMEYGMHFEGCFSTLASFNDK